MISEPVPSCQPLIVTLKQEAATTWEGETEDRIPPGCVDWRYAMASILLL